MATLNPGSSHPAGAFRPHWTMLAHTPARRWAVVPVALVVAALLSAIATRYPPALAGVAGVGLLLTVLRSPRLLVLGFGVAAFTAAWFFMAAQEGLLATPSRATSVSTWALVVLAAGTLVRPLPVLPRRLVLALGINAAALALSVPVAAVRSATVLPLWTGFQGIAIALAPLGVMALVVKSSASAPLSTAADGVPTRVRSAAVTGLTVVAVLLSLECLYSLIQFTLLDVEATGSGPFTVGNSIRWWNWNALWGTFATTGKNAYGGAMALMAAVLLAWGAVGPAGHLRRLLYLAPAGLAGGLVILSQSRSAVLSLILAAALVTVARRSIPLVTLCAVVVVTVLFLPATSQSLRFLQQRGLNDSDAQARRQVWEKLLTDRNTSLLIGEGYNAITRVTGRVGAAGLAYSAETFEAPPPAENLFIRRLVEGGALGLLAFLVFLVLILRETFARSTTAEGRAARLALRCATAALIVQSLFADTLMFAQWAAVYGLLLGVLGGVLAVEQIPPVSEDRSKDNGVPLQS